MLKKIFKKYKIKPPEILSLGNSISDYKSARKYKIKHYNIFFNHNYFPKPKSRFLSSLNEFFEIVNNTNENTPKNDFIF